jgi:hypothetical protein
VEVGLFGASSFEMVGVGVGEEDVKRKCMTNRRGKNSWCILRIGSILGSNRGG